MKYYTLPKALYNYPNVKTVLSHNNSCILYKKLTENLLNQERIATSHCIVFVVKGEVAVKTYEGERLTVRGNEMLFMPGDTYLVSDFIRNEDCIEIFLVFFDHEIVLKFLNSEINKYRMESIAAPAICKLKTSNKVMHYFAALKNIYFDFENNKDILNLKILEFLHLVYLKNKKEIIDTLYSSANNKKKRNIESIMIDYYNKNITITDFANLSGRSVSTFNREFISKYGQTPKQWLIKRKMEKAGELLSNGVNVTNCAIEVGYSNVSHFIKAYKSVYGETPKERRKNNI